IETGHDAMPVELGPEFVHGVPGATHALAREAQLVLDPIEGVQYTRRDGQLVEAGQVWRRFGELLAEANEARRDESARAYLARLHAAPDDARMFAHFVEGFYGAALDDISIASIAGDASGLGGTGA